MAKFRGLVYVKHGRVGSRSEGPDYYLQTYRGDFLLRYQERQPWKPDYQLEFYGRRMVEIEGDVVEGHTIKVRTITEILSPLLPRPGYAEPHLGDPFDLKYGQSAHLGDAPLTIGFLAVEQDSRCPIGLVCVWAGQVIVTMVATLDNGDSQKFTLTGHGGQPDLAAVELFGYRIELHSVKPWPTKGDPQPKHELYTINVEVNPIA